MNPSLIVIVFLSHTMHVLCSSGGSYRSPGETSPERVEMAIGQSVNISCHMHPPWFPSKNSSDLYFVDGPTQQRIPAKDIAIVNESTIVFMLQNATERLTSYQCRIGKEAIMESTVHVGTPPKQVHDFNCRSYDYEFMLCNYTKPYNPVFTQYNLTFHTHSLDYSYQPNCYYERKPIVCNMTLQQKYNPSVESYHFNLKAINTLGTLTQRFDVNIWNSMILARPGMDFRVIDVTTDKLQIAWKMIKYVDKLKRLQWDIMLKSNGVWLSWLNMSDVQVLRANNEFRLRLNDLPFAYYWYDLKLRVRVRTAIDADNMWSNPFLYRFQTNAKRPDQPPRTDVGSFYVAESKVRLYWEQLPDYNQNGANFSYHISEVKRNGTIIQLQPLEIVLNSAVFEWHRYSHYEFSIKSRNHIGESLAANRIEIYPLTDRYYKTHTPRPIHNVYHAADRTYTLTWEPPESSRHLLDYTVYWCYSKRALQNECKGSIHFKRLNKHETKFTTDPQSPEEEHTLNMAVSANYFNYNTGMHWTPCTVDINSDLVKMEPEIQASSAVSIHVQLSSDSICPSILEGYNLTYCEVNSSSINKDEYLTSNCLHSPRNITIDKNQKKYELTNLKPYTNYKIELFMFSRMKVGKSSDPVVVRTEEAAPSPPRQLQVSHITNISARISWLLPSHPNGKIRYYVISYNNGKHHFSVDDNAELDPGAKLVFDLQNLTSFTPYKVYVTAHTVNSSDPSNDIDFTTLIGYPSMPTNVKPMKDTENNSIIQWNKPLTPNGRLEFYEVAVIIKRNEQLIRKRITAVYGGTSCALQIPQCIDHDYQTVIEVRAVNAALKTHEVAAYLEESTNYNRNIDEALWYEENEDLSCVGGKAQTELQFYQDPAVYALFKSPWQLGQTYGCAANRLSKITTIALMVIVLSLGLMGALYMARKKYNKMANIDCTLPPGLESYPTKTEIENSISGKPEKLGHHRSTEFIFQNEKYHLLASVGNDLGYLGDGRQLANASLAVIDGTQIPDYVRTTSESSADSFVESTIDSIELDITESQDQLNIANIEKPIHDPKPKASENYSMHIVPANNGYIKPTKIMNWPEEVPTTSQCGGYVSVGSIGLAPPTANGYVQPQALQKSVLPTAFSHSSLNSLTTHNDGYTTLDELGKQTVRPQPQQEQSGVASHANKLISGYVTQRDLTAFGQQGLA